MLTGPIPKPKARRYLRRAGLSMLAICAATAPAIALVHMTVETPVLGMTGWRTKPVTMTIETPVLGMTGWRAKSVNRTIETPVLGMTGWRASPAPPQPPQRAHPFDVVTANLTLFHENQPLPRTLHADCPAPIGHKAFFTTRGELPGKITYHFEWSSGQRSTDYTTPDTGDRNDPLYEPPSRLHEFPYPLPAKSKPQGDIDGLAANESESNSAAEDFAAPSGPANAHRGSVRVVVPNAYGRPVVSGWARYDIVCNFKPGLAQRPRTICIGGSVTDGQCLCPSATRKVRFGANGWRCIAPTTGTQPP